MASPLEHTPLCEVTAMGLPLMVESGCVPTDSTSGTWLGKRVAGWWHCSSLVLERPHGASGSFSVRSSPFLAPPSFPAAWLSLRVKAGLLLWWCFHLGWRLGWGRDGEGWVKQLISPWTMTSLLANRPEADVLVDWEYTEFRGSRGSLWIIPSAPNILSLREVLTFQLESRELLGQGMNVDTEASPALWGTALCTGYTYIHIRGSLNVFRLRISSYSPVCWQHFLKCKELSLHFSRPTCGTK